MREKRLMETTVLAVFAGVKHRSLQYSSSMKLIKALDKLSLAYLEARLMEI